MNKLQKLLTVALIMTLTFTLWVNTSDRHVSDQSKAKATVMITNLGERSGGTGVVLSSSSTGSTVLTNAHVCNVVKNGGVVKNGWTKGFVTSYKVSQVHDLCLIETNTNFHTSSSIASNPPELLSQASVAGHPHLAPVVITKGSFSNHQLITVMTGIKPCTKEDAEADPISNLICTMLGGFPIIKTYEAQFIGATIQAGNSGSAVYNDRGEVAGLVFAGSGDLSYAEIVPEEYIYNFLNTEVKEIQAEKPTTQFILDTSSLSSNKLRGICLRLMMGDTMMAPFGKYCSVVNTTDLIYTK